MKKDKEHIYVRVPEPLEVKKSLLETKKTIYLQLHSSIEFLGNKEEKLRLIDKVSEKLGEIKHIIDKLEKILPEVGEEKEKEKPKKSTRKRKSEVNVEEVKEIKDEARSELDELRKIEEELLQIEEELKKLL